MREPPLQRYAELIVAVGANVQPGQLVDVWSALGKEELTRAVTAAAYRRGAKFVDVAYYDPWIKRARVEHVAEESLEYIPPWFGERALQLGEARAASISFSGPTAAGICEDLDPHRVGRDIYPRVKEWMKITNDRTVNWSVAPAPTEQWARMVYPELDPA
jgi:aminopeptidase